MTRRNDPLRSTLQAPADYGRLVAHTGRSALRATLPVDEARNEALRAMRDDVLEGLYCELLGAA